MEIEENSNQKSIFMLNEKQTMEIFVNYGLIREYQICGCNNYMFILKTINKKHHLGYLWKCFRCNKIRNILFGSCFYGLKKNDIKSHVYFNLLFFN